MAAKKKTAKKTSMAQKRADYGKPIDGFFAKQGPALKPVLEALRKMVEAAAPTAQASLKWGMPFYTIDGETMCALAGFKSHANLILPGGPGTYADPTNLLEGESKLGRHLKVRTLDDLPRREVAQWLKTAASRAKKEAKAKASKK